MFSGDHPLFESATGAENQAAGVEQTPEAQGQHNDQFIRGWDSLSPSSVFFQQASEQAAQSVGSFIRRPMQLPPPTQVVHRWDTEYKLLVFREQVQLSPQF